MAFRFVTLALLGMAHMSRGLPAVTLQDLEVADDSHSVGSYIREVRAASPQNYHKSYENEGDGELGYSRKKSGGGKKGYQHFDSYHKKDGDNYEFEKQDSYGKDDEDDAGAYSHRHETKEKLGGPYRRPRSHDYRRPRPDERESLEQYRKPSESDEISDDVERVSNGDRDDKERQGEEKEHEEIREAAPDGNGGVEANGHDPKDYTLPEKYTYGTGDEYNF